MQYVVCPVSFSEKYFKKKNFAGLLISCSRRMIHSFFKRRRKPVRSVRRQEIYQHVEGNMTRHVVDVQKLVIKVYKAF